MGSDANQWTRFCKRHVALPDIGFAVDVADAGLDDDWMDSMSGAVTAALDAMEQLERGAIANVDEQRMVGHYWLRDPDLAPTDDITREIRSTIEDVVAFAKSVHDEGVIEDVLHIGIGGSTLGPQLVDDAIGGDRLRLHFIDNTDPDGFDRVLAALSGRLDRTLVTIASKSGGTPESRNAMIEVQAAYERAGVPFAPHAVAITGVGSGLDELAAREGWRRRFPIWDWVGGRTSVMSTMGLLPAALQGVDVTALLAGAAAMDRHTRDRDQRRNPAVLMALTWRRLAEGRDMVILPYKDRLLLLGRYLQQLVMESLGKTLDRGGRVVHQGLTVYGNKGSTDQHAYVQQLRDGVPNFFVTFVEVLRDRVGASVDVEPGVTAGDYLAGLLQGTRHALRENDRPTTTITIENLSPTSLGALIALFERTVGLYAELIDVNAYHQPGVEAGKKAAATMLDLQRKIVDCLRHTQEPMTMEAIAEAVGAADDPTSVFRIVRRLAANPDFRVRLSDCPPHEATASAEA